MKNLILPVLLFALMLSSPVFANTISPKTANVSAYQEEGLSKLSGWWRKHIQYVEVRIVLPDGRIIIVVKTK